MDTTYPVSSFIEDVIREVPGRTPADQLLCLHTLVLASADIPGDILEIGSWCGRSTVVLAHAAQLCGQGMVQSIDLFPEKQDWRQNKDGSWSFSTDGYRAYHDQTVYNAPWQRDIAPLYQRHDGILEIFLASLEKFHVEKTVRWHKGNSASLASGNYRLCFIDGDHGYDAVTADINYCLAHMQGEGYICFDDAFSSYKGVDKAIHDNLLTNDRLLFHQQLTRKFHVAKMAAPER